MASFAWGNHLRQGTTQEDVCNTITCCLIHPDITRERVPNNSMPYVARREWGN